MQAYRSKLLIASVAISCFVGPAQSALHQARTAGMPQRFLALARAADFLTAKAAFANRADHVAGSGSSCLALAPGGIATGQTLELNPLLFTLQVRHAGPDSDSS
jgi:hypothetical protein